LAVPTTTPRDMAWGATSVPTLAWASVPATQVFADGQEIELRSPLLRGSTPGGSGAAVPWIQRPFCSVASIGWYWLIPVL
jgi:hypothetical protein